LPAAATPQDSRSAWLSGPRHQETALSSKPQDAQAKAKAEASFKRKETLAREATKAMADYQAAHVATREKTARLKKLRLAKEAADAKADAVEAAKPKAAAKKKRL
jgi:hypothetical protein